MFATSINKKIVPGLLFVSLLLLCADVALVFIGYNTGFDEKVFTAIAPHISESRTNFMSGISFLGNHKFLIPANFIFIVYFISQKNKWAAITAGVVAISSLGLMSLFKNVIGRNRPSDPLVQGITNFSFPSGHAFMSVAFYGLLIAWIVTSIKSNWQQRVAITFLVLLILLIGFSRIYLRVHYMTDVIAGLCIGTIWLITCLWLMNKAAARWPVVK